MGFYSAFMVADMVTVISAFGATEAYKWNPGAEGYTIEPAKDNFGTEIILKKKIPKMKSLTST